MVRTGVGIVHDVRPRLPRVQAQVRAGLVLGALIAVAAVANLGLAVANVALPSIGKHFDASQTALNLVAVGYSLGLAAIAMRSRPRPWRRPRSLSCIPFNGR